MDSVIEASYMIANLTAGKSKPFPDGDFVRQCMESMADIMRPHKKLDFRKISFPHQTAAR